MSEVKIHRYDVNLCPDRQCNCGASFATEECPDSNGDYVRYVDHAKELAALRAELAIVTGQKETWLEVSKKASRNASEAEERLADAERRNAEMRGLLAETSKAILRHQAEQPMSHRPAGLLTKARAKIDRYLKAAATQPTESGASE